MGFIGAAFLAEQVERPGFLARVAASFEKTFITENRYMMFL